MAKTETPNLLHPTIFTLTLSSWAYLGIYGRGTPQLPRQKPRRIFDFSFHTQSISKSCKCCLQKTPESIVHFYRPLSAIDSQTPAEASSSPGYAHGGTRPPGNPFSPDLPRAASCRTSLSASDSFLSPPALCSSVTLLFSLFPEQTNLYHPT